MLLQASESALCSWLSGEAPWVAVAPIDDGPMESDVVPHVVEDPVALLCSVMSCASSGVTNICGTQAEGGTIWSAVAVDDGLMRCSRGRTAVADDGPASPGNSDHGLTLDVVMIVAKRRCYSF